MDATLPAINASIIDGPAWPGIRIICTTRSGGHSLAPYDSFNLGDHVGDDPAAVAANRQRLVSTLPAHPLWLQQVHGIDVADADRLAPATVPQADAAVTASPNRVLAIMTADCLPIVIATTDATVLAVAHAGWRGLADGVLEQALQAMRVRPGQSLQAWIGPGIGPDAFEVGDEVRSRFVGMDPGCANFFVPNGRYDERGASKWMADLPGLAQRRLERAGVAAVAQSGWCTVRQPERFFSYRRDGRTGRFATLAWISASR